MSMSAVHVSLQIMPALFNAGRSHKRVLTRNRSAMGEINVVHLPRKLNRASCYAFSATPSKHHPPSLPANRSSASTERIRSQSARPAQSSSQQHLTHHHVFAKIDPVHRPTCQNAFRRRLRHCRPRHLGLSQHAGHLQPLR